MPAPSLPLLAVLCFAVVHRDENKFSIPIRRNEIERRDKTFTFFEAPSGADRSVLGAVPDLYARVVNGATASWPVTFSHFENLRGSCFPRGIIAPRKFGHRFAELKERVTIEQAASMLGLKLTQGAGARSMEVRSAPSRSGPSNGQSSRRS